MGFMGDLRKKKEDWIDEGMRQGYYSLHQLILFEYFLHLVTIIMLVVIPLILLYRMCWGGFFGLCDNKTAMTAVTIGYVAAVAWLIILMAKPVLKRKKK